MLSNIGHSWKGKLSEQALWRLTGERFVRRFRLLNRLHYGWPISISFEEDLYRVRDDCQSIFIARPRRLVFYWNGVLKRLTSLANQYLLERICFARGDVVIDVGANVGELGKWFEIQDLSIRYFPLEPSGREFQALQKNVPDGHCLNIALWKENENLDFYDRNDTGDSSLFHVEKSDIPIPIPVRRLDSLGFAKKLEAIKLLKVEAEGAEPEVLMGASGILSLVEYITVDCGFERGVSADSTADEVVKLLSDHGFINIGCNPTRLILLFQNRRSFDDRLKRSRGSSWHPTGHDAFECSD